MGSLSLSGRPIRNKMDSLMIFKGCKTWRKWEVVLASKVLAGVRQEERYSVATVPPSLRLPPSLSRLPYICQNTNQASECIAVQQVALTADLTQGRGPAAGGWPRGGKCVL